MKKSSLSFFLIFIITLIVYYPILLATQTVDPDAQIIIPNIESFSSVMDYLSGLFSLNTIDFQPIRDLTLALDLLIFDKFSFNTVIIQNFIYWNLSLFVIYRMISSPERSKSILLLLCLFSIYPLFAPVIGWGMSRKHILAFLFILLAVQSILNTDLSKKSSLKSAFFYLLSLLSQPIHILWPVWVVIYLNRIKKTGFKKIIPFMIPSAIVFLIMTGLNYWYYEFSPTYLHHFPDKTDTAFQIADKLLASGHYTFQLLAPYFLAFKYNLGDIQVLVGLAFLIIGLLVVYKVKELRLQFYTWIPLAFLPMIVVLNTPNVLSDSYLLLPAFALFMTSLPFILKLEEKKLMLIGLPLILFFSIYTNKETRYWTDTVKLTEISFERRENCQNAFNYMRILYEAGTPAPAYVKDYVKENECIKYQSFTAYNKITITNFLSSFFYFEEEIPFDERIQGLTEFSKNNMIAHLTLAGLYIKKGMTTEANNTISEILSRAKGITVSGKDYHFITANVVEPYCEKMKWIECMELTSKLSHKIKRTYL